ncbi:hypothetical protein GGX14DRAFT_558153 [Mycena pura]|uniref:Uncharacterized protein n=1 Tax=Mycena pura TaxID=153505 RepID=A0AAD6YME1_9AGAR|nr:hypothetical protein GGX14DRAFT_558153 [Mycena pura]
MSTAGSRAVRSAWARTPGAAAVTYEDMQIGEKESMLTWSDGRGEHERCVDVARGPHLCGNCCESEREEAACTVQSPTLFLPSRRRCLPPSSIALSGLCTSLALYHPHICLVSGYVSAKPPNLLTCGGCSLPRRVKDGKEVSKVCNNTLACSDITESTIPAHQRHATSAKSIHDSTYDIERVFFVLDALYYGNKAPAPSTASPIYDAFLACNALLRPHRTDPDVREPRNSYQLKSRPVSHHEDQDDMLGAPPSRCVRAIRNAASPMVRLAGIVDAHEERRHAFKMRSTSRDCGAARISMRCRGIAGCMGNKVDSRSAHTDSHAAASCTVLLIC